MNIKQTQLTDAEKRTRDFNATAQLQIDEERNQRGIAVTDSGKAPRRSLEQALAEGNARHNERKARLAGAVFVRSLDGYVIGESDLLKLIDNQKA